MIVPGIRFVQGRNAYNDGDNRKYAICIHNTSNDASDEGEASYAARRTDGVSSHFYCDHDSVTQSIDTADKCGHVGSAIGNENSIAVEITGANAKSRAWWLSNVAWDDLGAVLAKVIRHHWPDGSFRVRRATVAEMKANPKVKAFYSHDDCRRAWGGTTHTDPGPNFPWDRLFSAVNAALEGDDVQLTDPINYVKGPEADYSRDSTTVGTMWGQTLYYVLSTRNKVIANEAADKARDEAILALLKGVVGGSVDVLPVLERISALRDEVFAKLEAEFTELELERDELRAKLAAALAAQD